MADKDKLKTTQPRSAAPTATLAPRPPEQRTLVPTTSLSRPLVLEPKTMPQPKTIAPPRPRDKQRDSPPVSSHQRLREEPRPPEPSEPTLTATIGDEVMAQIQDAVRRGDTRSLKKAARAGAMLGVDEEHARQERKLMQHEENDAFANAIKRAKHTLKRLRRPKSEGDMHDAEARFGMQMQMALLCDPSSRSWDEVLALLGTSNEEIEAFPERFYAGRTATPEGTFEPRTTQDLTDCTPEERVIEVLGRTIRVVYPCGRRQPIPNPTPQIASGQPIDPPRPQITPLIDGSYRLQLPDASYLMRHEDGVDQWVYYLLDAHGNYRLERPLVRLFRDGKPDGFVEPSSPRIIMESYIAQPLCAFIHEVGSERYCSLAVQMKSGNVVVYDVPWSDEILRIENGPLIEIVCGFVPKAEVVLIELAPDSAPVLSIGPMANA